MLESRCRFTAVDELLSLEVFPPRVCVGDYSYVNNGAKPCRQRERKRECVCVIVCQCLEVCMLAETPRRVNGP